MRSGYVGPEVLWPRGGCAGRRYCRPPRGLRAQVRAARARLPATTPDPRVTIETLPGTPSSPAICTAGLTLRRQGGHRHGRLRQRRDGGRAQAVGVPDRGRPSPVRDVPGRGTRVRTAPVRLPPPGAVPAEPGTATHAPARKYSRSVTEEVSDSVAAGSLSKLALTPSCSAATQTPCETLNGPQPAAVRACSAMRAASAPAAVRDPHAGARTPRARPRTARSRGSHGQACHPPPRRA